MALWDSIAEGFGGSLLSNLLIGAAAVVLAPIVVPAVLAGMRPVAKTVVKGSVLVFDKAREDHPALADAVWHGLRANAVIRLRQSGYSIAQISDMIGMSPPMVERYCRHADRKAGGQAVLLALKQGQKENSTVKR